MANWKRWCAGVALSIVAGAGCTPTDSTPSLGGVVVAPQPGATWVAGDSISASNAWPAYGPTPLASVAVPGRGFVVTYNGPTIGANTLAAVDQYGTPSRIVIMGGVNDLKQATPPSLAAVTSAMEALESALVAQGIEVVWATEPAWDYATQIAPLNEWIRTTRSHVVDCAWSIAARVDTVDGIHPNDAGKQGLAACIAPRLAALP